MGAHKIWTTLTSGLGCLGWEIEKYEDKEETADEDTKLQDCHDCTNTNITKLRVTRLHKRPRMSGDGWILCWKSFILSVESVTIGCGYDLIIYQYLAHLLSYWRRFFQTSKNHIQSLVKIVWEMNKEIIWDEFTYKIRFGHQKLCFRPQFWCWKWKFFDWFFVANLSKKRKNHFFLRISEN